VAYALPVDHRTQVDLTALYRAPTRDWDAYQVNASGLASYLIADRWEARAKTGYTRELTEVIAGGRFSRWTAAYSASIAYYVEDRTRLSLGLNGTQTKLIYPSGTESFTRDYIVQLGATYFLTRGLDAPELFEPHHMLSPTPPLD